MDKNKNVKKEASYLDLIALYSQVYHYVIDTVYKTDSDFSYASNYIHIQLTVNRKRESRTDS